MSPFTLKHHVDIALKEDLGLAGDITSQALFNASERMDVIFKARAAGIVCGLDFIQQTYQSLSPDIHLTMLKQDGDRVRPGDSLAKVQGPCRAILSGERVALNYLCHLSGIASVTACFVEKLKPTSAKLACTRKTTPGLRDLEKYAVRCGGGINHRFGLFDAVMLKDNHIAAAGSIQQAVTKIRENLGHMVKVEVEIDHLHQLDAALSAKVDVIMLDNMPLEAMRQAVIQTNKRAILEASGNVTLETVANIAHTGVDIISTGWITHSAPILDIGLDIL